MIGRVLVYITDHLVAPLKWIAIGDHRQCFRCTGHHRDILWSGFQQLAKAAVESLGDASLTRIFKDHTAPNLFLTINELPRTLRSRSAQRRNAAIGLKVDVGSGGEMVEVAVQIHWYGSGLDELSGN
jgi:hypothetical protein